jgi:hypothetical protein
LPEVTIVEKRRTFVLWISRPATGDDSQGPILQGHLEEVDTGRELRFRSAEQLIALLKECMNRDGSDSFAA